MRKFLSFLLPILLLSTTLGTVYGATQTQAFNNIITRLTTRIEGAPTGETHRWLTDELDRATSTQTAGGPNTLNTYLQASTAAAPWATPVITAALGPILATAASIVSEGDFNETQDVSGTCNAAGIISSNPAPIDLCIRGGTHGTALAGPYKQFKDDSLDGMINQLNVETLENTFLNFDENQPNAEGNAYLQGERVNAEYTANVNSKGEITKTLVLTHYDTKGDPVGDPLTVTDTVGPQGLSSKEAVEKVDKSLDDKLNDKLKSDEGTKFFRNLDRGAIQNGSMSPIGGSPASLMAQYVRNDYNSVHTVSYPGVIVPGSSVFSVIPTSGTYLMGNIATSNYGLGINYVKNLSADNSLIFEYANGLFKNC
jgi:hypothetical protein